MGSTAGDEFRDLLALVRQSGLMAKQPAYYVRKMLLNFAMFAGAFVLIAKFHNNPWVELCNAAFLAFVFAQLGFIVHDAGHQEIFSRPAGNEVLGLLHSNLLLGFSYSWWLDKHNHHHCSPNHVTADPDVDLIPFAFSKDQAAGKHGWARLSVRYQHFSFFPLSLLEAFVLKYDSIRFLVRNKVAHPVLEVSLSDPARDLVSRPAHLLARLPARHSFRHRAPSVPRTVSDADLRAQPSRHASGARQHRGDFSREQVLTSRNIKNHPGIDFCTGNLTCQIEHHLFPTMPANKLRKVQEIVRSYCRSHDVPYHETSLFQSYREIYQNLKEISLLVGKEAEAESSAD